MIYDGSTSLKEFLDAAAAKQPTPGGGAVAALCGALGAAMGEMVVNYSIGKKNLAEFEPELRAALEKFRQAREHLLHLMVEDQSGFAAMSAAKKLPAGPDRDAMLQAAVLSSIAAPQQMGTAAVAVLETCLALVDKVNYYLLSDLAVCGDLAMATARCAVYNVRVNLSDVADPAERSRIETAVVLMLSQAATLIQAVGPRIWTRHAENRK